MKRLWIVAAILLFILGISGAGLLHLNRVTDEMETTLEQLAEATEHRRTAQMNELSAAFQDEWRKNEEVMVRYIHHDALDAITGFVALLPPLARHEQYAALAAEVERIQALLCHIREAEVPNWKNIF